MHMNLEKGTGDISNQISCILVLLFHLFVCIHHGFTMWMSHRMRESMTDATDQRIRDMERFSCLFFTSWNFLIQVFYFYTALCYDIFYILSIWEDLQKRVLRYKGYIFISCLFPFAVFVSTMFWGVFIIDRELVFPTVVDEYIPMWMNHCLHTNILIFAFIELFISNQLLPTVKSAFIGLNMVVIPYHILIVVGYFILGRWIYGLFQIFTWPERIAFVLLYYLFVVWMMRIGMAIQKYKYTFIWRKYSRKSEDREEVNHNNLSTEFNNGYQETITGDECINLSQRISK
ncbi:hypothetical protein JTB14_019992 [Gonioctena quinquepunctata]|nr:hypothetical protein JTB14_019992 [Gonioctena quinquepunctata]